MPERRRLAALDGIVSRLAPLPSAAKSGVASGAARPAQTLQVRQSLAVLEDRRSELAADVLAPSFIKIGSENGSPDGDLSALVDPLRRLADQAVEHGTRIAIEPMPFSRIASVPMGAELVSAAAHPAVGLVVDAWHVFRAGTTLDELSAAVPPGMVFGVELDDAASEVFGTLFEDTVERRLLCGEGSFDLPELVDTLRDIGFTGPWGVEILSGSFRRLPVDRALQLAADSARSVL